MRGRSMTSARYGAAAHRRRRGFLADDLGRSGGLIVEPLRRSPVVLYMCIGLSTAARRIGNAADASPA